MSFEGIFFTKVGFQVSLVDMSTDFEMLLENNPNQIRAPIGLKPCFYLSNRPLFLLVYSSNKPRGMLREKLVNHEPLLIGASDLQV